MTTPKECVQNMTEWLNFLHDNPDCNFESVMELRVTASVAISRQKMSGGQSISTESSKRVEVRMSEQAVCDGLTALRLSGMKEEFEHQQTHPAFSEQPFSDRVLSLVNSEVERRKNNRINRLIKNAKFKYLAAPEDIKFSVARGLPKSDGLELLKCAWVDRGQHILITGPCGTGKTWLSCALGIAAAQRGNTVRYGRISKILEELQFARLENSLLKTRGKLANYDLLILDDFALHALTNQERMDLFELIEERSSSASLIVVGQRPVEDWYDYLQDALIADAFMDRVRSGSRMINLSGDSLR